MIIKNLKIYQLPIEYKSGDRFVDEIDEKILKYKIDYTQDHISYEIDSLISNTINIPYIGLKNVNYMSFESDLFKSSNKVTSYWFVVDVGSIPSMKTREYDIKLDSFATFGSELFDGLNNKEVMIERAHDDRYLPKNDKGEFWINKESHGLINSDFNVSNQHGSKLDYKELDIWEYFTESKHPDNVGLIKQKMMDSHSHVFARGVRRWEKLDYNLTPDNTLKIKNKIYYTYAILNTNGSPLLKGASYIRDLKISKHQLIPDDTFQNELSPYVITYCNLNENANTTIITGISNKLTQFNSLPKGKLMGICISPIPFALNKYLDIPSDAWLKMDDHEIYYPRIATQNERTYLNFSALQIEMAGLRLMVKNTEDISELGLLNQSITPINILLPEGNTITINIYQFLKNIHNENDATLSPDFTWNENDIIQNEMYGSIESSITPTGISSTLNLGDAQFISFNTNKQLSYTSSQGATYLAQNKMLMDVERKRITLQRQLGKNNYYQSQIKEGASLSWLNPIKWFSGSNVSRASGMVYESKNNAIRGDLAALSKQNINAKMQSFMATPPSITTDGGSDLDIVKVNQFTSVFMVSSLKPNPITERQITFHYKKFGYLWNDFTIFNHKLWNSRSKFNYLQITNLMDYVSIIDKIPVDVLTDLSAELSTGVRIWHENDVRYNIDNNEVIFDV